MSLRWTVAVACFWLAGLGAAGANQAGQNDERALSDANLPPGYAADVQTVDHPAHAGRDNCLVNPADFNVPEYACDPIDSIEVFNPSLQRISDIWLMVDGDELSYPPARIIDAIFANPSLTDLERTRYLFAYMTLAMHHHTPGTYDNAPPYRGLKAYGFAWCTDMAWAFGALMRDHGGFPVRMSNVADHDAIEVLVDGRWRLFDLDMRSWLTNNDYEPISVLDFKALADATVPLQKQRSTPGLAHAIDLIENHYVATASQFSESMPPFGVVHTNDIALALPPLHRLTYYYHRQNLNFAGLVEPEVEDSIGNLQYTFALEDVPNAKAAESALIINADSFTIENEALMNTDRSGSAKFDYAFASEYPVVNVEYTGEGEGVCVQIIVNGVIDTCRPLKNDTGLPRSFALLLRDNRVINAERNFGPIVTNSTVRDYTLRVRFDRGAVLRDLRIKTDVQFNKQLFPRLTSGTASDFVALHRPKTVPTPEVNVRLSESVAPSGPVPVELKMISVDGTRVSAAFEGPFKGLDWSVVDKNGLAIHPNLMGWANNTGKIVTFDLLNEQTDGLSLRVRPQKPDGTFGLPTVPIALKPCRDEMCPTIDRSSGGSVGAYRLSRLMDRSAD